MGQKGSDGEGMEEGQEETERREKGKKEAMGKEEAVERGELHLNPAGAQSLLLFDEIPTGFLTARHPDLQESSERWATGLFREVLPS